MFAVARQQTAAESRFGVTLAVVLAVVAVVPAHHLTTYALVSFLMLWLFSVGFLRLAPARWVGREPGAGRQTATASGTPGPGGLIVLALVVSLAWLIYVAGLTIGYLTPVIWSGISELIRLIAGEVIVGELARSRDVAAADSVALANPKSRILT